jgi:hypothetical protein
MCRQSKKIVNHYSIGNLNEITQADKSGNSGEDNATNCRDRDETEKWIPSRCQQNDDGYRGRQGHGRDCLGGQAVIHKRYC